MADLYTRNGLSIGGPNPQAAPSRRITTYSPPVTPQIIPLNMEDLQTAHWNQYPNDPGKYYMILGMSDYNRPYPNRPAVINVTDAIKLPLPLHLVDNHMVDYIQTPLGFLGAGTWGAAQSIYGGMFPQSKTSSQTGDRVIAPPPRGATIGGAVGAAIGGIVGGLATRSFRGAAAGAALGGIGGAAVGGSGAGAAWFAALQAPMGVGPGLQAWSGYSPNQFFTILLKGPTYKRNEFIWKLSPNNPEEAMAINKIIRKLNNAMAPGFADSMGLLFSFPRVFTISIMPNSMYMFKFKPCVLENLTANYTGAGRNAFLRADPITSGIERIPLVTRKPLNAPESIELRLRFMELEFWLTGDFRETNDPSDVYGPNSLSSSPTMF